MKLSIETEGEGFSLEITHIPKDRDSGIFSEVKQIIKDNRDDPIEAFRKASKLLEEYKLKKKDNNG